MTKRFTQEAVAHSVKHPSSGDPMIAAPTKPCLNDLVGDGEKSKLSQTARFKRTWVKVYLGQRDNETVAESNDHSIA